MILDGSYDLRLVVLSVVVAVFVSYTAFGLTGRVADATQPARGRWLLYSALVLGAGIWSMHFIGMLALRLPARVSYDATVTLLSVLPAILGALLGLHFAKPSDSGRQHIILGGICLGSGIAAMHYTGMAAMRVAATYSYTPELLALSVIIAVAISGAALRLTFAMSQSTAPRTDRHAFAGALVMGMAIAGMHYTAMAAVSFVAAEPSAAATDAGLDPLSLATLVAAVTLSILAVAQSMSRIDRTIAEREKDHALELEAIRTDLEKQVQDRTQRLREAVSLLKRDIKARENAELALKTEKERAEVTLSSIADAVVTTDHEGGVEFLNPAAERLLGWGQDEAKGKTLIEVCRLSEDPRTDTAIKPLDPGFRDPVGAARTRFVLHRRDGRRLVVEEATSLLRDEHGNPIGTVMVLHDVTQAQRMADELRYHASHDALTGLVNRREFERRLENALRSARQEHNDHALAYIDLDQFKVVNDICGHIAGDALLRELAAALREKVRDNDTLARLGGDEFGFLLEGCPLKKAEEVAETVRRTIDEFNFSWNGKTFSIGASIGLVPINFESDTVAGLMSAADIACYAAKDLGRNRVQVYHPSNEELARRHGEMHWVAGVNKALQQDRFILFAQTIKPLRDGSGALPHREILIRILEKDGTLIPPGAFIPPAERYDLMPKVDRWVVTHLFSSLAAYLEAHPEEQDLMQSMGMISVNLSAASINDELFLHFLRDQFSEFAIPPEAICFEITETAVMASLDRARNFVREVRDMGCQLALDDFGSGMSSFNYLKNLPVDYLKIDGGFVRELVRDTVDQTIIESINRTGHALGIRTVAEMVEEHDSIEILRRIGVDYAQGMAISPPRPLFQPDAVVEARGESEINEDLETTLVELERSRRSEWPKTLQ